MRSEGWYEDMAQRVAERSIGSAEVQVLLAKGEHPATMRELEQVTVYILRELPHHPRQYTNGIPEAIVSSVLRAAREIALAQEERR